MTVFNRILCIFFWIYIAAYFTSMAVMEMASWTLFAMVLGQWVYFRWQKLPSKIQIFKIGLEWPFVALILVVTIGYFLNRDNPILVEKGIYARTVFGGIRWVFTLYMVIFLLVYFDFSRKLLGAYSLSLAVASLYGFLTFYTGWDYVRHRSLGYAAETGVNRAFSFLGFPMTWGHTLALALPLSAAIAWAYRKNSKRCWLEGFTWVIATLNLLFTFTRGAWLGAGAGLAFAAARLNRKAFAAVIAAFFVAATVLYYVSPTVQARMHSVLDPEAEGTKARLELWQANIQMFKDNPWFGVGLNANEFLVPEYHEKLGHVDGFWGHAHNIWLQFLGGTGGLGFVLFAIIFGFFFWRGWTTWKLIPRENEWDRALLLGSLGGQMAMQIGGMTECNFKAMTVNHHSMFMLALTAALYHKYSQRQVKV